MDGGRCGRRRQEGDSGGGEPVVQLEEEHEHDDDDGEDALNGSTLAIKIAELALISGHGPFKYLYILEGYQYTLLLNVLTYIRVKYTCT